MSTSIGKLQVDFIANLDKFIGGINTAMKKVDEFARKVGAALKKIEMGLKEIGEKMTKFVTLPLLALAAAAIKAADPTGEFAKELKGLGVEALIALEPLGKVLIDLFREAEPYIRNGIGFVRALAEEFAALEPSTQRLVVIIAGAVAAIGPLALIGAGLVGVVAALTPAFGAVAGVIGGLVALSVPVLTFTAVVGGLAAAAYLAFNAGRALYEQSEGLQVTIENLRAAFAELSALVRRDVKLMMNEIVTSMSQLPDSVLGFIKGTGVAGLQFGTMLSGLKAAGVAAGDNAEIWRQWAEQVGTLEQVHKATLASIERDFADNPDRKGFGALMAEDLELVSKAVSGIIPNFDVLVERAKAWAAVSPEMAKAWEDLAKKVKDTTKETKNEDVFGMRVQRRIENFAGSVGDSFADMALDGENSFKQLAASFERMLVSMFATQMLFQPLFDAIGGAVGGINWGRGAAGAGAAAGSPSSANLPGMALSNGFRMGDGGTTVNVIDQRKGGSPVEVTERAGPDGRSIDVLIRDSMKKLLRTGELDKDMRVAFGATRTGRV